jgi:GT2 family glycosyltransferase
MGEAPVARVEFPESAPSADRSGARTFSLAPATIVAIPARDEALRIEACLDSLAGQETLRAAPLGANAIGVLLLLNNCRDNTAEIARTLRPHLPFRLVIKEIELPADSANAGAARRLAMEAAAAWLVECGCLDGYLLTTDADTRVAPDWIARHHVAFARGTDAVAGLVFDDPDEHRHLPARLRRRGHLEARYERLLTELESKLDPDPDDPWPRHSMAAGASLGVRLSWYFRVGGVPNQATGEDRALVRELQAAGARIRHCVQTQVVTSCRLDGRAPGGMADTMRQRIAEPDSFCDEALEPVAIAIERYGWRATLRRGYGEGRFARWRDWAPSLAIPAEIARRIARRPDFPAIWEGIEAASPHLRAELLRPSQLPAQIALAKQALRSLPGREIEAGMDVPGLGANWLRPSSEHRADRIDAARLRGTEGILA